MRLWTAAGESATVHGKTDVKVSIGNDIVVINNEMSEKDQKEFGEHVEKWVTDLAALKRNKSKKLPKRYACAFARNSRENKYDET